MLLRRCCWLLEVSASCVWMLQFVLLFSFWIWVRVFFFNMAICPLNLFFLQSVYGVLNSIEGCTAFEEVKTHTNIGDWYKSMQIAVKSHYGAQAASGAQALIRNWPRPWPGRMWLVSRQLLHWVSNGKGMMQCRQCFFPEEMHPQVRVQSWLELFCSRL